MSDVKCKHCNQQIEQYANGMFYGRSTASRCIFNGKGYHEPADPPKTGAVEKDQPNLTSEAQVIAQRIADAKREVAGWTDANKRNAVATLYSSQLLALTAELADEKVGLEMFQDSCAVLADVLKKERARADRAEEENKALREALQNTGRAVGETYCWCPTRAWETK